MSQRRSGDAGLSLIEVLVSLAIFAVIGVAGLAVLNTVARTGERTEGRLERLAEIDRAFLIIRRDLAQITRAGATLQDDRLSFQRAGPSDPVNMVFTLTDGALIRQIDANGASSVSQKILTEVEDATWRVMDGAREWHSAWPPVDSPNSGSPVAAELSLSIRHGAAQTAQAVTRLMPLPGGQTR